MIADSTFEEQLALAQADSRDMKRTVIALRTELEHAHAEIQAVTARVNQANAAEISQLKTTVGALREELERARVVITATDRDHFAPPPDTFRGFEVLRGDATPSRVVVPVRPG